MALQYAVAFASADLACICPHHGTTPAFWAAHLIYLHLLDLSQRSQNLTGVIMTCNARWTSREHLNAAVQSGLYPICQQSGQLCWFWREEDCQQQSDPTASVIFTAHPTLPTHSLAGFGEKRTFSNPWIPQQLLTLASSSFIPNFCLPAQPCWLWRGESCQ